MKSGISPSNSRNVGGDQSCMRLVVYRIGIHRVDHFERFHCRDEWLFESRSGIDFTAALYQRSHEFVKRATGLKVALITLIDRIS